ncbi:unnamed protein product [Absidia cylindrospora]
MPEVTPLSQPISSNMNSILAQEQTDHPIDVRSPRLANTISNSTSTRTTVVYSHEDIHISSRPQQKPQKQHQKTRSHPSEKVNGIVKPVKSMSCTTDRKSKQQHVRQHQRQLTETNGWADEDVNGFREEEFDFQANLDMFDKAKVFAEIQEIDETASENLLVTLNRLPRKVLARIDPPKKKINLLPSENVLEATPNRMAREEDDDGCGNESDNESEQSGNYDIQHQQHRRMGSSTLKKSVTIVTANDSTPCPVVSPLQMAHAEHECVSVIGLNEDQMVENGSRGTFEITLKILNDEKQAHGNDRPLVLVLSGSCKNGAYGLATARRLLNYGHRVVVCMVAVESTTCLAAERQKTLFERIGGMIIYGIEGLMQMRQPDLVIDAMLGSQTKLVDLQDERTSYLSICDMIEWVNNSNKAPVLSIDFPAGVDASTGQHYHPIHYVQPQWTVCLGAPKTGCISLKITGELFMVDLGYPRLCWKKVGLKKFVIPWGANFIVGLKYL